MSNLARSQYQSLSSYRDRYRCLCLCDRKTESRSPSEQEYLRAMMQPSVTNFGWSKLLREFVSYCSFYRSLLMYLLTGTLSSVRSPDSHRPPDGFVGPPLLWADLRPTYICPSHRMLITVSVLLHFRCSAARRQQHSYCKF